MSTASPTNRAGPVIGSRASPARGRAAIVLIPLAIVPAVFLWLGTWLEHSTGPHWFFDTYDPDYPYLFNALNIAEGHAPRHIDHPGTPVQELFAGLLIARHWLTNPVVPLRQQVLGDPEAALRFLGGSLRALHAGALLGFGVVAWRFTRSALCAVAAQLSTICSLAAAASMYRVTPEPFMLTLGLLLAGAILMVLSRPAPARPRFAILSGIIAAAGMASKATFAPACLAPWGVLIVGGRARRLIPLHIASMLVTLAVLLAPVLAQFGAMLRWFRSLAVNTGAYGTDNGYVLLNPDRYTTDLLRQISAEPVAAAIAAIGSLCAAALFVPAIARRLDDGSRRWRAALVAAAAAQIGQFLLASKFPTPRYLVPAVAISGLTVCLLFVLARAVLARGLQRAVCVASLLALGVAVCWSGAAITARARESSGLIAPRLALSRETQQLIDRGAMVAFTYTCNSPGYALLFGDQWAGYRYAGELERLIPGSLVRFRRSGWFLAPRGRRITDDQLRAWAREGRLYFQGAPQACPDGFQEVPGAPSIGGREALYRAPTDFDPVQRVPQSGDGARGSGPAPATSR